ncbi:MAG: hypothetical protein GVY27_01895 [Deinococcus-Thermus bacterium]|jgi:hypothetical protein|nr:hypothetical protein [Deinococcota bacterium]
MRFLPLALCGALLAPPAPADPAEVVVAEARPSGAGWLVSVTLRHGDTGWDDYADGWRIVTAEGEIVGTRPLAHPHVNEQPFTRSLSGVALPEGADLYVESSTSVTGWSGDRLPLRRIED